MIGRIFSTIAVAGIIGSLNAANPVTVKHTEYQGWGQDELALRENMSVSNDLNRYTVTAAQWKPKNNRGPEFQFWLFEPRDYSGFSRPIMDFIRLEVNGIREIKLQPKKEDIKPWSDGDKAGYEMTLNFDGAKVLFRWFMRKDSPVLWCTLKPAPDSVEPLKSVKMWINAIPSKFAKDAKGGVVWNGGYARQAVTATRTVAQSSSKTPVTDADGFLIIQDAKFDGSSDDKGGGPCIIIPGREADGKMALQLNDAWLISTETVIVPTFKEYTFGLWAQKNRLSNAEAAAKVKAAPEQFKIK